MGNVENMNFFTIIVMIFMVFNAYGQIPVFLALLAPYDHKKQQKIMIRELIIALFVLLLFILFGSYILSLIGVSKPILGIGGGVLVFLIALDLLFPKDASTKGMPLHEPLVVPLAIPGLAGPGSITAMMVITAQYGAVKTSGALVIAWAASGAILLAAGYIKNYLGEKGLQAIEKLGGMIIALIGVQMLASGIVELVKENFVHLAK